MTGAYISLRPPGPGNWPRFRSDILDWLITGTRQQRFIDNIFVELCQRLVERGIPVSRGTLYLSTLSAQWRGARILWRTGADEAAITTIEYGVVETSEYLNSPMFELRNGSIEVRKNLEGGPGDQPEHSLFAELRGEGYTDYVAWPLFHTLGKQNGVTFASDRPGGFDEEHLSLMRDLLPAISLVTEIRLKNILARTLLETYVGPHASEQILAGATTRGSGVTISAAIMICDMRDFTAISDLWPRDDVIGLLNAYFDALSEPIEEHGGEILKLMGDGLLAIFPLTDPDAARNLLRAISEAQVSLERLNEENVQNAQPGVKYGIGVHIGDVMYGNIGSRKRLDFTAIGPAVNVASRLESLSKELKRPVLLSKEFVEKADCYSMMESLGEFHLRGLGQAVEVFAYLGDVDALKPAI